MSTFEDDEAAPDELPGEDVDAFDEPEGGDGDAGSSETGPLSGI